MNEEKRKVLEMLSDGKIGVDDAERLLQAVESPGETWRRSRASSASWSTSLPAMGRRPKT
jgi:hypothetical protein